MAAVRGYSESLGPQYYCYSCQHFVDADDVGLPITTEFDINWPQRAPNCPYCDSKMYYYPNYVNKSEKRIKTKPESLEKTIQSHFVDRLCGGSPKAKTL